MAKQLRVVHGLSDVDDIFPGEPDFDVDDSGVLLVKAVNAKVYNRDVWASAFYEDVP